ncbi:IS110 family transposase [Pelotomaculum schinkii]
MDAGHLQAARKAEVIAGFEHIEHYWFALGDHLVCQGHKLAIVNSFHVKRTKELDDNSPTKNDRKDPKTILDRHDEGI